MLAIANAYCALEAGATHIDTCKLYIIAYPAHPNNLFLA